MLNRINSKNELVERSYDIFKKFYGTSIRETKISSIVNGESIEIKNDNILIDVPVEEQYRLDDKKFQSQLHACNKKLYNYQINAIKKILELERRGYVEKDGKRITSNAWLLSLPIGSGKSIVFNFIALFFRAVPSHPIILSRDGSNIPEHEQIQWKEYPYHYETCMYETVDGKLTDANSIITMTNYIQRAGTTVILTHMHLLDQMHEYFETDFKREILGQSNIQYAMDVRDVDWNNLHVLVLVATIENINELIKMSYDMPFMRVIIDDYTSMPNIDSFRQILASSTLFVSGSGFQRRPEEIPASYYTLKYTPVNSISIVGRPEETLEGVFRNNVASYELMGSSCEFSQYEFISECEDVSRKQYREDPKYLYPPIEKDPKLYNYMSLMFILKNLSNIKKAIQAVEQDLITIDPRTKQPKLSKDKLKYYFQFKELINKVREEDEKRIVMIGKNKKEVIKKIKINNKLYEIIYKNPTTSSNNGSPLVTQTCLCCGEDQGKFEHHNGYGMVASCCGAFFCSKCLKNMTTRILYDSTTGKKIVDKHNYYCCCCRCKNSKYYINMTKKKDSNIYAYHLIKDYFEHSELDNLLNFDYYFYMIMNNGFVPLYHEGRGLNIANDISQGAIKLSNTIDVGVVPTMEKILPKDQLAVRSIEMINKCLMEFNITPKQGAAIMIYNCPKYMVPRLNANFMNLKNIAKKNNISFPLSNVELMYRNSVGSLIGLNKNILGIIVWEAPKEKDEIYQIAGRLIRINGWNNKLTFYITASSIEYN